MSKNKNRLYPSMCSLPLCMKPHNQFMSELQKLSRHNRQNSVLQPPNIFGHLIDLQKLYNEVVIRGGHKQVTISHLWMEVYLALGLPPGCVDAGHGLRTLYQRYLELFERNQRMMTRSGFTSDEPDSAVNYYESDIQDLDQTMKVSKTNTCGASVRLHTEEIPSHLRGSWNLSTDLKDDFEYTSLERSLLSGLPNEVELALNTVLLMSSQLNSFSINKNPRLLDVLLCSVGITCSSNGLMSHSPDQISSKDITCHQRKYLNFWESNVDKENGRAFLSPTFFSSNFPEMIVSDKICHSSVQEMTYGDEEAFRVQLVATVLRNLAVDDALSAVIIGRHPQALRFTFLCIYAKHSCLHQLGLEILSSLHFPVLGSLIPALHRLLTTLLVCPDRIDRIHGLQIVKNLCTTPLFDVTYDCVPSIGTKRVSLTRTDRNIAFLTSLPPATFSSIASTLCLRDLHLVVLAVDTIHNLTSLGPALCDRLLQLGSTFSNISTSLEFHLAHQNISLLPLLVALLNLEAQAMGSDSLIRVRVMQALGAEPITKSSVSKPVASIVSLLAKTTSTAVLTTSNPFTQPQDPTVVSTTTPIVQLPIHCSQSNLTLPLNHPSHCTSYHPSIHDSSSQISTEKTSISVSHNYLPTNVSSCCSFSISSNAPVINSSANGIQVTDSCRVNKRDLLIRNCLPIIPTPRVSFSRHETDSVIHTTQQNSGSSSTIKSTLPVMQAHSVLSTTNSVVSNNGVPSVNGLKSKVCLSQQIPTALISNTSASTFNPEVQKQINTSSKYLATENGLPQLDRREFMFQWLKSNYAVHNHSSIPRIQIYNEYQKAHLQRFRNIGAVSPVDFHSQIKTIFPGVGQVKVQVPGGSVEIHYNNLKHVDAPEPESQQGINDIMASVLSPKVETINPESRSLKIKCRKRTITGTFPHLSSAKLASKNEDISNHVLKNTRVDVRELNGHTESSKLTNGQIIHPLNGLSRDTSDVISANSSVPNGPPLKKRNVCISASEDSCIQKASTTMVSLSDSKIVIVPVFTTYAIGHGLTLKGTITNDLPVLPNIQTTEHREVTTAKETFASTYSQTTTVSRTEVNLVKSIVTPHVVSCISSSFSSQSKKHIDSTAVPGNNSYNATTISGENLRLHCQWSMCRQSFLKSDELWNHFQNIHYESLRNMCQIKCAWGNCSEMIYNSSLDLILNHLTSKHCFQLPSKYKSVPSSNTDPNLATANTNQADCDTTEGTTLNFSPCEIEKPLIYDDLLLSNTLSEECHRALTGGISNPPFAPMPVHEGPVTKHLRLTAALALRNLLQYSDVARRYMSSWENLLCDLAFANLESSPTIFECLTLLSNSFDENNTSQYSLDEVQHFL